MLNRQYNNEVLPDFSQLINSSNALYLMTKFKFRAVAVACVKFSKAFIAFLCKEVPFYRLHE